MFKQTTNGANAFSTTGDSVLDLFSSIGAMRLADDARKGEAFSASWNQNPEETLAVLLWARDSRSGGAGERGTFRSILRALAEWQPGAARRVMYLVPTIGRWDDLTALFGTDLETEACQMWAVALHAGNALAAKWADREMVQLRRACGFRKESQFRKFLAGLRRGTIVEEKMCKKHWSEIDYSKLPSVAGARYSKAFRRNDESRYVEFLSNKETKVNASALFPHDVYRLWEGAQDSAATQKFWDALPPMNIVGNILPMCDVSGSMCCPASGSVSCMHVSISLGVYLAQRNSGLFKNKILTFSERPSIIDFGSMKSIANIFSLVRQAPWGANTNMQAAYRLILSEACKHRVSPENMPSHLLILSDMQFDAAVRDSRNYGSLFGSNAQKAPTSESFHNTMEREFREHGYTIPTLVYWNLNARNGTFPTSHREKNVLFLSGFSPRSIEPMLNGASFTPRQAMEEVLAPFVKMLREQEV